MNWWNIGLDVDIDLDVRHKFVRLLKISTSGTRDFESHFNSMQFWDVTVSSFEHGKWSGSINLSMLLSNPVGDDKPSILYNLTTVF